MKNPKVINETEKKIDRVEYDGDIYKKSGFSGKELKGKGGIFFENPLIICELISEDYQPPSIKEICSHFNPEDLKVPNTIESFVKASAKKTFVRTSPNYSDEYFRDRDYRKRLKIINNYCFIEEYINYLRPFSGKIIILSNESIYQEGKLINEASPIKTDKTISSEENIGVNQKLPYWFTNNIGQTDYGMEDVKTYNNGDIVINWQGKEIELNNIELTMYHYLIGAKKILENGMNEKVWFAYRKGIDWFRKNNPKAYMELFD